MKYVGLGIHQMFNPPSKIVITKGLGTVTGLFDDNHYLGKASKGYKTMPDLNNVICDIPIFVRQEKRMILVSRSIAYNPFVQNFVSLQVTPVEKIYRWNIVDEKGMLLSSNIVKRIVK